MITSEINPFLVHLDLAGVLEYTAVFQKGAQSKLLSAKKQDISEKDFLEACTLVNFEP